MPYIGYDFDPPQDAGVEQETLTLDFYDENKPTLTVTSATMFCGVANGSKVVDSAAAARPFGPVGISGTKVSQRFGPGIADCYYIIGAVATLSNGDVVELWTHLLCVQPG